MRRLIQGQMKVVKLVMHEKFSNYQEIDAFLAL